MKKTQIILAVITALVILSACIGFLGYFGAQTARRFHQRAEARAAFAAQDWRKAEQLLKAYVSQDLYSESDFVRLAQVYRHFRNTEEEMRCWGRASALNPHKREYWDNYITCALNARAFAHLYTTLAYKLNLNEKLPPREQMLYFICLVIRDRDKDAEQLYEVMLEEDPDAFHHDDLGRFAEFLIAYDGLKQHDRLAYLKNGVESEDPFVRQESILYFLDALEPTEELPEEVAEGVDELAEQGAEAVADEEDDEDAEDADQVAYEIVEDDDEIVDEIADGITDGITDGEDGVEDGDEVAVRLEDGKPYFQRKEAILKQVVDMNWFVGIPLLAKFYFSELKFSAVIKIAEPYLEDIEDIQLAVIYGNSCVFDGHPEKLIPLADHFRSFGRKYRAQTIYFEALYDFTQGEERFDALVRNMRALGGAVQTDLANLINLQIALNSDNMDTIYSSLSIIMKGKPFYDLQERARTQVRNYLGNKLEENPSLAEDTRLARLAQLISTPEIKDPFLMRLVLADLYRRNVVTRQIVEEYLNAFPTDPYLLQIAAEFELFYGNPERCVEYADRYYAQKDAKRSTAFDLLHMLAMEVLGHIDEAAKEYTALVDNSEMDRGILFRYFRFCIQHQRVTELFNMAERLDASSVPELKELAPYFRAEVLLLRGNIVEALTMLSTARTDWQDFALQAADMFRENGWPDQALSRYLELLDTYPDQRLILADIAEGYLAKEMRRDALPYAERAWELDPDDSHAQYVYAKALAANGRYQDAERILRIPYREVELPDATKDLWTDIMTHCVQEDFANRLFLRAYDRATHYLILYPGDFTFREFKDRAEEAFRQPLDWGDYY